MSREGAKDAEKGMATNYLSVWGAQRPVIDSK